MQNTSREVGFVSSLKEGYESLKMSVALYTASSILEICANGLKYLYTRVLIIALLFNREDSKQSEVLSIGSRSNK